MLGVVLMKKLLLAGVMVCAASAAHAQWLPHPEIKDYLQLPPEPVKVEEPGFWFGHRYYWPERDYYYNDWTHANQSLDRSEPTVADLPSWLRLHIPRYKHLRRR